MVELRKIDLARTDPRFTVGRTFKTTTQLRRWVLGYIHTYDGKLDVLKAVHDVIPEERAIVPPEAKTRTTIESALKYGDENE